MLSICWLTQCHHKGETVLTLRRPGITEAQEARCVNFRWTNVINGVILRNINEKLCECLCYASFEPIWSFPDPYWYVYWFIMQNVNLFDGDALAVTIKLRYVRKRTDHSDLSFFAWKWRCLVSTQQFTWKKCARNLLFSYNVEKLMTHWIGKPRYRD